MTGYLEFYKASLPNAVYVSTFARLLGDDWRDFNCLVAEVDSEMVGLTHYLSHRHAWKIEEVIYLQDLYVDPAVRGAGVERALIEAVYAVADAAGTPAVYWLTQDFNSQAACFTASRRSCRLFVTTASSESGSIQPAVRRGSQNVIE